ncbi:MAG: MBOAT family O-acyltransferase [Lachnospiraceae bacterium]
MVFSSLEFIFIFLPIFLLVYRCLPNQYRNFWIAIGSFIFYSYGSIETPEYIFYFFLSILMNYALGQLISDNYRRRTPLLVLGIIFNIVPLAFFKAAIEGVVFPIGISFFTFQNLSYILDVYMRKSRPERSFTNYAAYISMFPQLIAGPIVTYNYVSEQLHHRIHTRKKVIQGIETFVLGLGAKVLIANRIGSLWNDIAVIGFESISTPLAWMGVIAYSLQIYFDFWGYSLMAIGMGKLLGFEFPKNFDHPYASVTFSEFFRRWHQTLGSWFREYVYIPLGGNRRGNFRTALNLILVWLLTSLWHGIHWNFLLWGMSICILILLEKFVIGKFLNKHRLIGHLYVIALIPMMWLIFSVTDFQAFCTYLTRLFPFIRQPDRIIYAKDYVKYFADYRWFFLAGILLCFPYFEKLWKKALNGWIKSVLLLGVFGLSVYCIYMGMNDPFLYFRF